MRLSLPLFVEIRAVIHQLCGLALPEDKLYLVEHRLEPLLVSSGCPDWKTFLAQLRGSAGMLLREAIIEAITTKETSFFRDGHPFETLRTDVFPWLIDHLLLPRKQSLIAANAPLGRIWCTAASTGQEPYSVAMVLLDFLAAGHGGGLSASDFSILATDISPRVLAEAKAGKYSDRDVLRGLTQDLRERYFRRDGEDWVICERIRRRVTFRRLNLVQPLVGMGHFDVILCRNVLIYFDDDTRRTICDRLWDLLSPGGLLILGGVENLYGVSARFESTHLGSTIVYRKRQVPALT
jgi:chemotaxis protein methyltransferase CheR